ncbi:protein ERGIC-53 isoform X2 [Harpegnathos saltator]|uniref:protein ERGIC-53 isoform X2 n=1 Tax=Harpegnathos saltator TaxID=610380 RepID=UPI00058F0305|nr:protein ERGIC-53 isoform X2 [Harpegnathos saltator]
MKMAAEVRWLLVFLICCAVSPGHGETPHRKFEYKYSFKPPYLAQKDGSVPFWEYGGNAIASAENVRVAPSLRSQKGAIWAKQPTNFDWWEVNIVFRVTGRGRIGADGLAFWYTSTKGLYNGTVFGSSDMWTGLGIFFDSFDNDNKHNNPYIMAVVNDGTKVFDHTNDGSTQQLSGCLRDFRNKPFPTRARVEYYKNTLTLLFHNGVTENVQDYDICFRIDNVILPKSGFFGVSAATGGLADDHDVLYFLTTSLYPPGQLPVNGHKVSLEEQAKLNQEYLDYQKKLEEQKEEYHKEHPDRLRKSEFEDYFETENQRELRQVFEGQSQIFEVLRGLHSKLDEVVGRQERTLSLISQLQAGGVQVSGGQPDGQPMLIDTIRRQEVDAVLTNQNIILNTAREIKSFVGEVHSKAESILNNQARAPTAQPMGYDYQSLISELRDGLNTLKRDFRQTNTGGDCPTTNCLSTTMFFMFIAIQMIILLAYSLYRDSKEAQMKKLY